MQIRGVDEFNRLEEDILSAVSKIVQSIQTGLKMNSEIELVGRSLTIDPNTGIFITMNPGYPRRYILPNYFWLFDILNGYFVSLRPSLTY